MRGLEEVQVRVSVKSSMALSVFRRAGLRILEFMSKLKAIGDINKTYYSTAARSDCL